MKTCWERPDYLAPEQAIDSHGVDSRADIYGLGCAFYFLLTGHPPFPDGTLPQRLMAHQKQTPPSILNDRPDCPTELTDICINMMAKKPGDRYQTMQDVAQVLADWLIANGHLSEGEGGSGGASSSGRLAVTPGFSGGSSASGVAPRRRPQQGSRPAPEPDPSEFPWVH